MHFQSQKCFLISLRDLQKKSTVDLPNQNLKFVKNTARTQVRQNYLMEMNKSNITGQNSQVLRVFYLCTLTLFRELNIHMIYTNCIFSYFKNKRGTFLARLDGKLPTAIGAWPEIKVRGFQTNTFPIQVGESLLPSNLLYLYIKFEYFSLLAQRRYT